MRVRKMESVRGKEGREMSINTYFSSFSSPCVDERKFDL